MPLIRKKDLPVYYDKQRGGYCSSHVEDFFIKTNNKANNANNKSKPNNSNMAKKNIKTKSPKRTKATNKRKTKSPKRTKVSRKTKSPRKTKFPKRTKVTSKRKPSKTRMTGGTWGYTFPGKVYINEDILRSCSNKPEDFIFEPRDAMRR